MSEHHDPAELREQLRDDVWETTRQALAVLQRALAGEKFNNDEQRHACTAAFGLAKALIAPRYPGSAGALARSDFDRDKDAEFQQRIARFWDRVFERRAAGRAMVKTFEREGPLPGAYQTAEEAREYGLKQWDEENPNFGMSREDQEGSPAPDFPGPAPAQTAAPAPTAPAASDHFRKLPVSGEIVAGDLAHLPAADKQRAAQELMLTGKSLRAVAEAIGVTPRTLYAWRQDARFREELARRRDELWSTIAQRLRGMVHPSLDVLDEHLDDPHDKSRFKAATALLRLPVLRKVIEAAVVGAEAEREEP